MRLLDGPLQMAGGHPMQIAVHIDVLVDVTVAVEEFAGSDGPLDGHRAAVHRGKVTAMMAGAIGLILIGQLLSGIAPHTIPNVAAIMLGRRV
jgi:hypothetical protein